MTRGERPADLPETRKYIVGWLTFPPGARAGFLDMARAYVAHCRTEPGCLFFEMTPSETDPEVVVIAECFIDAEAHRTHLSTPEFAAFWSELGRIGMEGRFENVFAGRVEPDSARFAMADAPGTER